jgi:hypothetical protein
MAACPVLECFGKPAWKLLKKGSNYSPKRAQYGPFVLERVGRSFLREVVPKGCNGDSWGADLKALLPVTFIVDAGSWFGGEWLFYLPVKPCPACIFSVHAWRCPSVGLLQANEFYKFCEIKFHKYGYWK